jgi:hypothetical protein
LEIEAGALEIEAGGFGKYRTSKGEAKEMSFGLPLIA